LEILKSVSKFGNLKKLSKFGNFTKLSKFEIKKNFQNLKILKMRFKVFDFFLLVSKF